MKRSPLRFARRLLFQERVWLGDSSPVGCLGGIVAYAGVIAVVGTAVHLYKVTFTTISINATAGEYRAASGKRKGRFLSELGWETLSDRDRACGFDMPEDFDPVIDCFLDAVYAAPAAARLKPLAEQCGRPRMRFTGREGSPKECAHFGGKWGVATPAPGPPK